MYKNRYSDNFLLINKSGKVNSLEFLQQGSELKPSTFKRIVLNNL